MVAVKEARVELDPYRETEFPERAAGDWFVLHTRSRQEKVLADELASLQIAHFLPLVRQVRYHGRRKAAVQMPLFSSYVFLRGERDDAYRADRTKRVAQIISVADQEKLDWELRNLHLAMTRDAVLDPYPYLVCGTRVEVRSGPFRGLQGVVDHRINSNRLILQVELLGRAVSLEMDAALLDPIEVVSA